MSSRKKRTSKARTANGSIRPVGRRRQVQAVSPRRQFMQVAVPYLLPLFCVAALASLLKLDHPLLGYTLGVPELAGGIALGWCLRVAAREAASASTRPVPRWLYGLAGLCFLALTVVLARLAYAESDASGNEAVSIMLGFLSFYCAIGGVLCLGRALTWGPRRKAFWVFLARWLDSAG